MASAVSAVAAGRQRRQHPAPPHAFIQESQLHFGVKKTTLPRKTSWEKMVFRRSSVGDKSPTAAAAAAGVNGEAAPAEGCASPVRVQDGARQSHIISGCRDFPNARSVKRRAEGFVAVNNNNRGDRGKLSPRNVSANGPAAREAAEDALGRSWPGLERLTRGRTGVVKLARTDTHRRQAWTIFPAAASCPGGGTGTVPVPVPVDPRVKPERGEGHRFEARAVREDWCDACSRRVRAQALKCTNCSYTCHLECESQVQLDCNQRDGKHQRTPAPRIPCSTPPPPKVETKEEEEGGAPELSEEEARQRIEEYNSHVSENGMKLSSDGSYNGFIKVHLRLSRPVTVQAVESPAPDGHARLRSEEEEGEESACPGPERRTSFYLPCDCVKQLHISSLTSTREVIQGLLKMFTVLDNPCKFALYRQTHRDGQDLFQKLPLWERPLLLRLVAGPDPDALSFVLKENETGEVEWHAFSVPELHNFLGILEKEESERVRLVEQKYAAYRRKLQEALQRHEPQ